MVKTEEISPFEVATPAVGGLWEWLRQAGSARPWLVPVTMLTVTLGLAVWPVVKAHLEAVVLLEQVSGSKVPGILQAVVVHPVEVRDVTVPAASGAVRARLYLPADMPHAPGLMVLHGVHHLGIDEPRMEGFARALAGSGLQVLTPELPGIKDYRIGPESVRTIGESAEWFAGRTGGPVGVFGLSFAGGLALVAAEDPRYAPAMKMVMAVGSQASMPRVAEYYRTGRDLRPDGSVEALAAHEYGPLVLEYEHLEDFASAADLEAVRRVLRAHLYEDPAAEKAALAEAAPAQRALAARLMNVNDAATQAALGASIARHGAEMEALSPAPGLKRLQVPVFLLHGESDNVIPAAETLWMMQALPPETLRSALVSPVLGHVDMEKAPGVMDQWRVVHLMAGMLRTVEVR